ncbi:MAG: hypothetical protein ABIN91_08705 [Mucilaginibacter sp.]|uniref:hypothetical protein n=1 Tax=Mucilaginibacter sp. TaxID=1882438 RepID=UPI0032655CD4
MLKKAALILVFLLPLFSAFGQRKLPRWHEPTKAETELAEYNAQCVHRNKYSAAQRLRFYPFNKAVQVKLVAFYGLSDPNVQVFVDSVAQKAPKKINYWKYPFNGNETDTTQFIEVKLLNKVQVNKLTDILYNIDQRAIDYNIIYNQYACYEPRNAIVFTNSKGKIFAHIEICFECRKISTRPEKMNIGGYCEGKLDLLKSYFASSGIIYGVDTAYTYKFKRIR